MSIQGGAIFGADKEDKLVSILIPTYNSIKFVKPTIDSCLNQKYNNLEILISDDCSTDGTFEYLSQLYLNNKRVKEK
jgi:glycosyltransferase involved in cell wall biosynthesis